jgi:uncharacterized membrane protein (UPF0127 family)
MSGRLPPRRSTAAVVLTVLLLTAGCRGEPGGEGRPTAAAPGAPPGEPGVLGTTADALPLGTVTLGAQMLTVRIAATPAARAQGLMGVAALPEGLGMLFLWPDVTGPAAPGGFWMRDTLVPLDLALLADGRVVAVATMTPCAGPPCPITGSDVPYEAAVEVAAGWLAAAGVGVGAPAGWEVPAGAAPPAG